MTRLNEIVLEKTPAEMIKLTSNYWGAWIQKEPRSFGDLPTEVTDLFNRSLLILRTQIDNRGAIIPANDSDIVRFGKDTYSYMWGRDGAFVAAALAKAGYADVCQRFFNYCADVLSDEGYLMQHYNPDGSLASSWHPWLVDGRQVLPIQEDSTHWCSGRCGYTTNAQGILSSLGRCTRSSCSNPLTSCSPTATLTPISPYRPSISGKSGTGQGNRISSCPCQYL